MIFVRIIPMAKDLGQAVGAYAVGVLADYTGLGSIYLAGTTMAIVTLYGYLIPNRRGFLVGPAYRR
jgi:predicted MFS family arabinose efflux permease